LYIGHGIYKAYERRNLAWKNPLELPNQIKKLREYPSVQGSIYFSSKSFLENPNGWNDSLQNNYYKQPALIPPMKWIDSTRPAKPYVEKQADSTWKISAPAEKKVKYFILYGAAGNTDTASSFKILLPAGTAIVLKKTDQPDFCRNGCRVTVVNRNNNESEGVELR
jgi:hypothetical protein